MNYEQIILELMSRIQILEKDVTSLKEQLKLKDDIIIDIPKKISDTERTRQYILNTKKTAKEKGESYIILRAGDVQKIIGLKNRPVIICNAMRQCMNDGDEILHTTPSGYSTTVSIKYYL